jgi:hypothetical protein
MATSPTLRRMLIECQTWCTADCCKARAFSLTESTIGHWLGYERVDRTRELAEEIARLGAELGHARGQVVLSVRGLESTWGVEEFRAFWQDVEVAFSAAVARRDSARD